ncbi:cell division protein ZapE [Kistimonas scapharcae]|uniref:Cell division protein ZapE n=1 Tax=Kistimonas scapharcae TaxID=1036133 RepID=A0ABP8UYE6_9GAMM
MTSSERTPIERYRLDLQREGFVHDKAQEDAVHHLQRLYDDLLAADARQSSGLKRLVSKLQRRQPEPLQGLYFWGGVGRGKTYLVDTFFDSLPFPDKMRTHFHRFMRRVHEELKSLDGEKNPLVIVGQRLAAEARIICFDEFFVSDITDAMILGGLLEQLFKNGVTLVATSNIVPNELYKDGLQRARFLPAIDLLNRYTEVVNVDSGVDYRLRVLEQAQIYHHPLDEAAKDSLHDSFCKLVADSAHIQEGRVLEIEGRPIRTIRVCDDIGWFTFVALCDGPRSQNDYIELAREFHTVLIEQVPQLNGSMDDQARRFINLVDEFYDRGVNLIMSGETALESLYRDGRLEFEFKRTLSRLQEMQSREYLARPHNP